MTYKNICLLVSIVISSAYGKAENIAIGVGIGSTGADVAITYPLRDNLNIRGVISGVNFDKDFNNNSVRYKGKLKLFNAAALLDYHPFSNSGFFSQNFKVTAGLAYNDTKVDIKAKAYTHQSIKINGKSYSSNYINNLKGQIKWENKIAPYLGVGYGNPVTKKGMSISGDLGVLYIGKASTSLYAPCDENWGASNCNKLNYEVGKQKRSLNKRANKAEFWPVARIMLNYSF